jgi:hypothetical protein
MDDILPPDIAALEARLQADPDSQELREELLHAYLGDPALHGHPRRIQHILRHVRTAPGSVTCRSPLVVVDPRASPEGFAVVELEWRRQREEAPDDPDIARAAAKFLAISDRGRATELLLQITTTHPDYADAWMELGRISVDAATRVRYFEEAVRRACDQPNLQVWLAQAAVDADDWTTVEAASKRLLDAAERARVEYGDKLDWSENGLSMWARACAATSDSAQATALVRAIGAHAYHKHWGHTTAGHLALHQGDVEGALAHLKESAAVVGEPRLSSYGPSFSLAQALCTRGQWDAVDAYLRACSVFWSDERVGAWLIQVQRREMPEFPHQ